jgi:hypothetical protein
MLKVRHGCKESLITGIDRNCYLKNKINGNTGSNFIDEDNKCVSLGLASQSFVRRINVF